jgi:coenzyme F420-reducing hydrogenase beta subunit
MLACLPCSINCSVEIKTICLTQWHVLIRCAADSQGRSRTKSHLAAFNTLVTFRRNLDNLDDLHFGVHESMMYASNTPPVMGAQWTGIVTQIAIEMLESGRVEAVVCVQSSEEDRFKPKPVCFPIRC